MIKVSVIVPIYNVEKQLAKCLDSLLNQTLKDIQIILVNDGSKDSTYNEAKKTKARVIDAPNNLGIGGAVQTGYLYAKKYGYDIAIQLDGDGQHDVNYISNICEPLINGQADMCIGTRYLDKGASEFQSTFMRRFGSNIITTFIKIFAGKKITDPTSGFRAANIKVITEFAKNYPTEYPEPESTVSLLVNGYNVTEVPVSMNERTGGVSSIRLWKSVDYISA